MTVREVLLVAHTGRELAIAAARTVAARFTDAGVRVRVLSTEQERLRLTGVTVVGGHDAARDVDVVVVLGGDGSLLRGAELARPCGAALLGINLGHVGFLAEVEPDGLDATVDRILAGDYLIEERMTVDVTVTRDGVVLGRDWALNEVALEKSLRTRMLYCVVEVDGRPLQRWGCDGVVFATPTGSTAYAFSAGGPVVWPAVQAMLLVPISAHALFARPLVVSPRSTLAVEVLPGESDAVLSCDGRRPLPVPVAARVEVTCGLHPVRLVRLNGETFTDRIVTKFGLSVEGWRGRGDGARPPSGT